MNGPDTSRVWLALVALVAMIAAGCGAAPTPLIAYVTPAPAAVTPVPTPTPTQTAQPTPTAKPTPTPKPSEPHVVLVPCTFDLTKDFTCKYSAYHLQDGVDVGRLVTLRLTVKNDGSAKSQPLGMIALSTMDAYGDGDFLPDSLKVVSCNGCKWSLVSDNLIYHFDWPALAPGAKRDLIVTMRAYGTKGCQTCATPGGYYPSYAHHWTLGLYDEPIESWGNQSIEASQPHKLGEWEVQVTIFNLK